MPESNEFYTVSVDRAFLATCRAGAAALVREAESLKSHPLADARTNERADVIFRHARSLQQFADDALKSLVVT